MLAVATTSDGCVRARRARNRYGSAALPVHIICRNETSRAAAVPSAARGWAEARRHPSRPDSRDVHPAASASMMSSKRYARLEAAQSQLHDGGGRPPRYRYLLVPCRVACGVPSFTSRSSFPRPLIVPMDVPMDVEWYLPREETTLLEEREVAPPPIPDELRGRESLYGYIVTTELMETYRAIRPTNGPPLHLDVHLANDMTIARVAKSLGLNVYIDHLGTYDIAWFSYTKMGVVQLDVPTASKLDRFAKELGFVEKAQ
ncbi:hypothetical protein C8R45DRAFT_1092943 [Mycena sanguinolenta]|nr:hypothetical protein C8R45DRAFT_1092943 [Mycena sanguinolenta]